MATGASAPAPAPIPIYISSSLDTALGLAVSPDDTVLSLKRKLEQVHARLFPGIGHIIVNSLKIKSGQHWFHLSDFIPVKAVFHRLKGHGFLSMDAAAAPQHTATRLLHNHDNEEACGIKTHSIVVRVEPCNQPGIEQMVDRNVTTMEGSMQRGEPSEIDKPVKKKKRSMSLQEITEPALCSDENTRKKRRNKQIEGLSSDMEYEVQPVRESESLKGGDNVQENHMCSETETAGEVPKGDSLMTGNAGDTPFSCQFGNVPTGISQLEKGKLVPEKDAISDNETEPNYQLMAEQTTSGDGRSKESMENSPRKEDLSDKTACTSNVNPDVGSPGKRIQKETKATSLDTSAQENLAQPNESCKGKESNTSFEIETCIRTGDVLTNGADEISLLAPNGRDPKEGLLDELKFSSPTLIREKASVRLSASEEPVSEGGKRKKRKKRTTPEVLEAGSEAHASDKKMSQTKNPREGKSKEKEGRSISLKDDVSKGDCITGEDSTEKASVPSNEFEELLSKDNKREQREKFTTPEVLEPESNVYASEKKGHKGKSIEKERSISLIDNVPKGDCIIGEDNTDKASVPVNEFEEPVSQGKKREKSEKLTTPEILEAESKAYASEKKAHKGRSKEKEGRIISPSDNVPKGDGITGEHSTEKASVPPNEFEEPISKDKKREKRKKLKGPVVLDSESKAYAREEEKKSPIGKSKEKEGRIISLSDNIPKGDGITGEDSTEEEDELERFRVVFRNATVKNNEEKMNALEVEEKASGLSTAEFPVQQCRLSGGHNWRCKEEALPGKNLCARHENSRKNRASRKNRR